MIAGVGIFGVVAASTAAWFISADQAQDRQRQADAITALTTELTALHQTVRELSARRRRSDSGWPRARSA
jgi:hypothetical protein